MSDALTVRNLQFGYGRQAAVRDVSLTIRPGDCYGFLGHNGAGKTTVMRLVLGLLRPAAGKVRVFGLDPHSQRRQVNALLGALVERPGFHAHVSGRDNLVALALLQGVPRRLARAESERVLDCVGLQDDAAKRRVGTYSMGMRQRLGIAQALLGRPRLLLLDEPGNGLDPEGIADLRQLLAKLTREEDVAVMLSSHQLAELEGLCSRVGVLREGRMVVEGDLDTLRRRTRLRHVASGPATAPLQAALARLGLDGTTDGDRVLVELGDRAPAAVLRTLATECELTAFGPEQATLERIYLSGRGAGPGPGTDASASASASPAAEQPPKNGTPDDVPDPGDSLQVSPVAPLGRVGRPLLRAFLHETRMLLRRPSTCLLLAAPTMIAAESVRGYGVDVQAALQLVEEGERFSADAGSGYLATARGLQAATPALALVLLWLSTQIVAADFAADTLRNTVVRSVRRIDVLLGKLLVLLVATIAGWLLLVGVTTGISAVLFGFGDLEEVSRYGDRDVLAAADTVRPALWAALAQLPLPLAGVAMVGALASTIARRPAFAVLLGAGLVLLPQLARTALDTHAGWLLTSHLPLVVRDDSVLDYLAATARGAADALWLWSGVAALAPLAWCLAAGLVLQPIFLRMRIR